MITICPVESRLILLNNSALRQIIQMNWVTRIRVDSPFARPPIRLSPFACHFED